MRPGSGVAVADGLRRGRLWVACDPRPPRRTAASAGGAVVRSRVHPDQASFEVPAHPAPAPEERVGRRRARYRHVHTPAELAAFERSRQICDAIRGIGLDDSERWCPGGCGKVIRRERRSCGRRWCDSVRPSWAASFRSVIHGALNAYSDLYGSEAKVLQGVLTCTAEPWWWDRSKCSHPSGVACSGPRGCRVLDSVAEDQRRLWSARRRDTLNTARTAAIRQLRREGWAESGWPSLLVWVPEDQSRGVPHLHFVLGHTTALEKAFARAFFRALKPVAYAQGLGHTSTYERAVLEQGAYQAGRLRHYVSKLAGYLSRGRERHRSCCGTPASASSTSHPGSVACRGSR